MINKLLFLIFGFIPFFAFSQEDFEYATTSKDGTEYYVKIVNTDFNGFATKAWIKHSDKIKTYKNKNGKLVTTGGGHTLTLIEVSCRSATYVIKKSVTYNKSGNVTSSDDLFSPISTDIVPGTVMEEIYNIVCS